MIDISSPKIVIPGVLFLALSNKKTVLRNSLIFLILFKIIAQLMGLLLTRADLLTTAGLFVLFTPGVLGTIPAPTSDVDITTLLHGLGFTLIFAFVRKTFPSYY
jgi:hypothetical protein